MSDPTADAKLAALSSHHENTYQEISKTLGRRDRTFLILVLVLGFFWLRIIVPNDVEVATSDLAQNQLGLNYAPSAVMIDGALWSILLAVCIRYFQCVVEINRLYEYIHLVEDELKIHFEKGAFTREGEFYSRNYHLFKWWAGIIYTAIFPLFLSATISIKIVSELTSDIMAWGTAFDATIYLFTVISIGLFVLRDFRNKFTKQGFGGAPSKEN